MMGRRPPPFPVDEKDRHAFAELLRHHNLELELLRRQRDAEAENSKLCRMQYDELLERHIKLLNDVAIKEAQG